MTFFERRTLLNFAAVAVILIGGGIVESRGEAVV